MVPMLISVQNTDLFVSITIGVLIVLKYCLLFYHLSVYPSYVIYQLLDSLIKTSPNIPCLNTNSLCHQISIHEIGLNNENEFML